MTKDGLEHFLAKVIGHFRRVEVEPLARRLDQIEHALQIEHRIARLEGRGADGITAKLALGAPVGEREWRAHIERMQHRDIGEWNPARHVSWRGGR